MRKPVLPNSAMQRKLENDHGALLLINENDDRIVGVVWLSAKQKNRDDEVIWAEAKAILMAHLSYGVTHIDFQYAHQELFWTVRPEDDCLEDSEGGW